MVKCKCTFAIRMLGEGCRYCQPQECIDRMHEQMADDIDQAKAKAAPTGTVKDSLTVEVEIVAYAAFAENGNIQMWDRSLATFENLYNLVGDPQPLMTVAQHQEITDRLLKANVPYGYQLVPVNPTVAMLDAAVSYSLKVSISSDYNLSQHTRDLWLQMLWVAPLRASQSPPAQ